MMSAHSESSIEHGIGSGLNWLIGGAVGGIVGSLLFGGLLWVIDPDIVTETIPAIYGLPPAAPVGWVFHLIHGLVLGVLFGFLVSRPVIGGTLTADAETDFIDAMRPGVRLTAAGIIYGLAVWTALPVIALSIWGTIGGVGDPAFPATALESLVGHLLYGLLLGALFSVFVGIAPDRRRNEDSVPSDSDSFQE